MGLRESYTSGSRIQVRHTYHTVAMETGLSSALVMLCFTVLPIVTSHTVAVVVAQLVLRRQAHTCTE